MIPTGFIQDLLARVDIVDVVGRHVQLRKGGANLMGLCPFHGEKSPSFSVSPAKQFYYCFGCGASGNAIGFLTEHLGMNFVEAVKDLAQEVGMVVPEDEATPQERERAAALKQKQATLADVLAKSAEHFRKQLRGSPRAIDYLKGRGLSGEVAARFGLGYAPDGWRGLASVFPRYDDPLLEESGMVIAHEAESGQEADRKRYDRFRDRIMFPIRSVQGDIIGFGGRVLDKGEPKYLNSPETPVFSKGRELYGLFEARTAMRQRGYALVVEGYMDVVALAQSGFANAVATLGTACTADHVQKLFRFTDSVVFSFDGDAAGRRAAGRALEASLPHASDTRSIRFLFLPAEHDPDSYVREHGAEAFEQCVQQAVPLSRQLVDQARDGDDLSSTEGRARFLSSARPLWEALPDGAFRRQLLGELAQTGGMSLADLADLWRMGSAPSGGRAGSGRRHEPQAGGDAPWSAIEAELADSAYEASVAQWGDMGSVGAGGGGDLHGHAPYPGRGDRRPGNGQGGGRGPWQGGQGGGSRWEKNDKGGWRRRDGPTGPATDPRPLRTRPPSLADQAMRMLLVNSSWWDQLPPDDHGLLHSLPEPHGSLCAWLERQLVDHGPLPWAGLMAELQDDPLGEMARRIAPASSLDDLMTLDDLRRVLDTLWVKQLEEEKARLIQQVASDPQAITRLRELDLAWKRRKGLLPAG